MKLTLIFPIKNQADKLIRNLHEQVLPYYDKSGLTYDIIIVNDHSFIPRLINSINHLF